MPRSQQYHNVKEGFEVVPPWLEVLLTDQTQNANFHRLARSLATEPVHDTIKIGRLLLMVVYNYEDEDTKAEISPKKGTRDVPSPCSCEIDPAFKTFSSTSSLTV